MDEDPNSTGSGRHGDEDQEEDENCADNGVEVHWRRVWEIQEGYRTKAEIPLWGPLWDPLWGTRAPWRGLFRGCTGTDGHVGVLEGLGPLGVHAQDRGDQRCRALPGKGHKDQRGVLR